MNENIKGFDIIFKFLRARAKYSGVLLSIFVLLSLVIFVPSFSVNAASETKIHSFTIQGSKYLNITQTIEANATTDTTALYKFMVRNLSDGVWITIQDYSEVSSVSWTPQLPGDYQIGVHVKDINSDKWLDADRYTYISYTQIPVPTITSLNVAGGSIVNSSHKISASASGNENMYKFLVRNTADGSWTTIKDYSAANSVDWIPVKTGEYQIGVHVKNKYSNSWLDRDRYTFVNIITLPKARITSFAATGLNQAGSNQTIAGSATSVNKAMYKFMVRRSSNESWTMIQDYSFNNKINWVPDKPGTYQFGMHVKDENSKNWLDQDTYFSKTFSSVPLSKVSALNISGQPYIREKIIITAEGSGVNAVQYKFLVRNMKDGIWTTLKDYSSENSVEWIPQVEGQYQIGLHVKDNYSNNWLDSDRYLYTNINPLPNASITSFVRTGDNHIGSKQTFVLTGKSVNKPMYKFLVRNLADGNWITMKDYSPTSTFEWVPEKAGQYQVGIHIKDEKSTNWLDSDRYMNINFGAPPLARVNALNISGPDYIGGKQRITAAGTASNELLYKFLVRNMADGVWTTIQDYSTAASAEWIPEKAGQYQYGVHVKDRFSSNWLDQDRYILKNHTLPPAATVSGLTISGASYAGSNQEIIVQSKSVNEPLHKFMVRRFFNGSWGSWSDLTPYSSSSKITWQPESAGSYQIGVHVKDKYSNKWLDSDRYIYKDFLGTLSFKNSYYEFSLSEALDKQMLKNPQTDLYGPDSNGKTWQSAERSDVEKYLNPLLHSSESAKPTNKIKITSPTLNVRAGYNTGHPIIGTVFSGEVYNVLTEQNGWYKIQCGSTVGWVSGSYTELIPEYKTVQSFQNSMYQFMDISSISGLTSSMINRELEGKGVLANKGQAFLEAATKYRISEIYLLAHVLLETGNGTSKLSNGIVVDNVDGKSVEPKMVYNLFGIGAVDGSAIKSGSEYAYKQGWYTIEQAIHGGVKWISENYVHHTSYKQNTLYKMRWNPNNPGVHQYATDIGWALKQTRNMGLVLEIAQRNNMPVIFDLPVYQ